MKKISLLIGTVLFSVCFFGVNAQCSGGRYHSIVFPGSPTVVSNVIYGNNTDYLGNNYVLKLDVYKPACDTVTRRPLIVFAHGGSFVSGDKADASYAATATALAQLGYVVASINYRLGFPQSQNDPQSLYGFNSAIMRGVHDGRAAVRFLRNDALTANTYGIDPTKIFFGGVSAGGIIALHLAYQNTQAEQNMNCNNQPGAEGTSIEGTSNGAGSPINSVSSAVTAIISISGGIRDLNWITTNDIPCMLAHGTNDQTVPYGSGYFVPQFQLFAINGSSVIDTRCTTTGTTHCFKPMYGQDHIPTNTNYVDTLATIMRSFLEHFACNISLNCTYNGSPAVLTPAVSISTPTNPVCGSQPMTFTATVTNGGTNVSYQWKKGSTSVGTNSPTYTLSSPANGDVITCVITTCASLTTTTSNAITVQVTSSSPPTCTISVTNGSSTTCAGQAITFTATSTNGGNAPTYQWKKGVTNVGTGTTYTLSSPANGDAISCVLTSNSSCANPTTATSNTITVTVSASVAPVVTIAISSGNNPTCTGQAITFAATATNGGNTPTYQWRKGTTSVGTAATYTLSAPANGDEISCIMTSSSSCASPTKDTSNVITVTVSASVAPTLSIAITSGTNPTCQGQSVTFTGTGTNGGSSPTYQWKKNGTNTSTGSTYSSSALANGDIISCVMTSNSACASPTTATSNSDTMRVNPVPTITKVGNVLTSSAATGNQWYLNGQPINGGVAHTYTATASGNYTVSSGGCVSQATSVVVSGIAEESKDDNLIKVYPNPASGVFNLAFEVTTKGNYELEIRNETGQVVYREKLGEFSGVYNKPVDISREAKGVYFVRLSDGKHTSVKTVIIQ